MNIKSLWIITGIVGSVFLIILISLAAADKIKIGSLILAVVIVILLSAAVIMVFWYIDKNKRSVVVGREGEKKRIITPDEAAKLVNEILIHNYAEYEDEVKYKNVWSVGESKTPVYVRLVKGKFDNNYIGIVINLEDSSRTGYNEYREEDTSMREIMDDLRDMANSVAFSPRPTPSTRTITHFDPVTGRIASVHDIPVSEIEKKEEGDLK